MEDEHWTLFTVKKLNAALAEGKPVLIDFTADWCLSCKYFEKTVLQTDEIKELMDQKGVVSLKADCTKTEMQGAVFLARLGSGSVPVLALFMPEAPTTPTVIRGGFYKQTVLDLLEPLK
jgi:thiol:disulfide interchange protein DsbD